MVNEKYMSVTVLLWRLGLRTTSRATTHAEKLGRAATVATTLASAVTSADIIFTCVGDDVAIDAIVTAILDDKTLDLSTKTFIDCSTVHPDTSRRTEAAFSARGALLKGDQEVPGPVGGGGDPHADSGVAEGVLLTTDGPDCGSPDDGEADDEGPSEDDRNDTGEVRDRVGVKDFVADGSPYHEADEHPGGTDHQALVATVVLDNVETDWGGPYRC